MKIYFNTGALALAAFRDDSAEAAYMAACDGLRAAWEAVYNDLLGGRIDWASYYVGPVLYVLTRAVRSGAEVTRSVFWETAAGLDPVSHHDFTQFDAAEMPDNVNVSFGRI